MLHGNGSTCTAEGHAWRGWAAGGAACKVHSSLCLGEYNPLEQCLMITFNLPVHQPTHNPFIPPPPLSFPSISSSFTHLSQGQLCSGWLLFHMLNFAIKRRDKHTGLAELRLHFVLCYLRWQDRAQEGDWIKGISHCNERWSLKKKLQRFEGWRFGCSGSCVCFDVWKRKKKWVKA